jgi:hypothetical protein
LGFAAKLRIVRALGSVPEAALEVCSELTDFVTTALIPINIESLWKTLTTLAKPFSPDIKN